VPVMAEGGLCGENGCDGEQGLHGETVFVVR
jgi:hypothetical protein